MKRRQMVWISYAVFLSIVALSILGWLRPRKPHSAPILVHCAAGLRMPVEELARQFETETEVPVQLQFGGSQQLLASILTAKRGDLFIPGDDSYLAKAEVAETLPLAQMDVVVVVRKGNPLKVATLADLMQPAVRVALPDPDSAATGKLARTALGAQ